MQSYFRMGNSRKSSILHLFQDQQDLEIWGSQEQPSFPPICIFNQHKRLNFLFFLQNMFTSRTKNMQFSVIRKLYFPTRLCAIFLDTTMLICAIALFLKTKGLSLNFSICKNSRFTENVESCKLIIQYKARPTLLMKMKMEGKEILREDERVVQ